MLLARGGEDAGPGTTQTQQNLGLLQNKWTSLNTKMDDRRVGDHCDPRHRRTLGYRNDRTIWAIVRRFLHLV